jgi:hypothetical protein
MSSTVPSVEFSDAKVHLSDVMTKVVYGRQPRLVRRHRGKEEMILLRPDDLARSLNSFRFHPHLSVRKGEATAELPEVGILGFGTSADEAMTDLVEELRAYARRFFERTSFYLETDRGVHLPWLLRFAVTPEEKQLDLLYEDSAAEDSSGR